jgi:hypothetical protein
MLQIGGPRAFEPERMSPALPVKKLSRICHLFCIIIIQCLHTMNKLEMISAHTPTVASGWLMTVVNRSFTILRFQAFSALNLAEEASRSPSCFLTVYQQKRKRNRNDRLKHSAAQDYGTTEQSLRQRLDEKMSTKEDNQKTTIRDMPTEIVHSEDKQPEQHLERSSHKTLPMDLNSPPSSARKQGQSGKQGYHQSDKGDRTSSRNDDVDWPTDTYEEEGRHRTYCGQRQSLPHGRDHNMDTLDQTRHQDKKRSRSRSYDRTAYKRPDRKQTPPSTSAADVARDARIDSLAKSVEALTSLMRSQTRPQ